MEKLFKSLIIKYLNCSKLNFKLTHMLIYGKNAVFHAIVSNSRIKKVLIYENLKEKKRFIELCSAKNINYELVNKHKIEQIVNTDEHQGTIAYLEEELVVDVFENLRDFIESDRRMILILDRIQDPRNLGSIIRTSQILGVKNIVSTYNKSCKITPSVIKSSTGAIFYVKFSYYDNLNMVFKVLKENNIKIFVLERGGSFIEDVEILGKLALVVGSEHYGVRRKFIEMSDKIVSLRQNETTINSYNVSIAVGIALYVINTKP
ncbi:MAG: 23S rRNA (guanosine(2251)-2'-O)-methyltransferase RlmB [candidate division WOR-3 bacterium]|nr:23S rRNA (guanosine(2251)-2'-O)-methyltransferase RlmB [candidate division WOR-3 bacterium]MCX7947673.1 23S rRNA (guanosine(2251)-2'-O)-methyltransferase RlmB [candidate division WOR-3 bacterium]MDW8150550.1 23S rRNA (guanosine(2251)-2'-O)-methyltransferase RlmB [candidate division WOR-3 bacterium]